MRARAGFFSIMIIATSLLVSERGVATTCSELFSARRATSAFRYSSLVKIMDRIRETSPMDVAPLLIDLGRQISVREVSENELRFIVSAIFDVEVFNGNFVRADLVMARYQRTLLWEVSDSEKRRVLTDLFQEMGERSKARL